MVFKIDKFSAEKVFRDCALTLGLVISSFIAGPLLFILIRNFRGDTDLSVVQNQRLLFLSLGILAASYVATHAKFEIPRLSAFIMMVSAPILITIFFLSSYSALVNMWLMLSPIVIWFFVRNFQTDYLSAGSVAVKNRFKIQPRFLKSRAVRGFVLGYVAWLFALVLTNNFEFRDMLDFEFYDPARGRVMTVLPLILTVIFVPLWKWYKRGE